MTAEKQVKVGIVGGTGYTGVELLRMLTLHPSAKVTMITSRKDAGTRLDSMFPSLRGRCDLVFSDTATADLTTCDVVFYATPHGVAMADAPKLTAAGVKIIDLAADFRFKDLAVFEKWYKLPHSCPDLAAKAAYGLVELNRDAIRNASIVGNPGCYPTTMQLGYYPLLKAGIIDTAHLIADCASGVSGAGKKADMDLIFSEASDNFKAYNVSGHRHQPETEARLQEMTGDKVRLIFTPHLTPMIRGMHSTLYAQLNGKGLPLSNEALQALFEDAYKGEPFVDVMPFGSTPDTRSTRGSNVLRIALHRPQGGDTVVALVAQDNLVKGAAGQAVQCMNLMFGLPETAGLQTLPLSP
ncbi:MAG TPA: N-acetyl-gamma-glutamyl-phosphate reductase [Casimicrobium huifangae]|uniref:N-acetyl-gamma-glutamyl-phosphate reductase n=1 Tax=Casimicrobium huifangae TaxID=2591109 RepID=UPI0012EC3617|nr:N-acetyl-gamma-glutamyl-phosphate reductase [Casimicrobium huifangae]HQA33368.1 N-acetyl-gamma-glutamyl-phosphate reductase [Casimicrobium huifangae]HQD64897.1 N-acetyl-gamma-glutamyl-phosphate reductase [Casimicrobium huifangae]